MNIERKIRLFFIAYGRLLFMSIVIILIFIFALKSINDIAKERKELEVESVTQNQMTDQQEIILKEQRVQTAKEKEYIKNFIDYCNTGKTEEAYAMLSEKCKQEKYANLQNFKEKYLNRVFNIKIYDYKIQKDNDKYEVTLIQDALLTGKTNSEIQSTYKVDQNLEGIYIIN